MKKSEKFFFREETFKVTLPFEGGGNLSQKLL